jgi:hypothetical protein
MSRSRFVDRVVWRHALATATLLLVAGVPAHAQGRDVLPTTTLADAIVAWGIHGPAATEGRAQTPSVTQMATRAVALESPKRPSLLVPLYVGFGALQALDAHSTLRALQTGAREQNPIVEPFGRNPAALFVLKSATTAGTIVLAEKLRRHHPVKAIVMMTAVNVAYAVIVAANYRR